MSWGKVDDNLWGHPKVLQVGNAAMGAWVRMLSWSARYLTDGAIPATAAMAVGSDSEIVALVKAGLLENRPGGFQIHDYLDYNPSGAEVKAAIEAKRRAGQAGGQASAQARAQAPAQAESKPVPVPVSVPKKKPTASRRAPRPYHLDARFRKMLGAFPADRRGGIEVRWLTWEAMDEPTRETVYQTVLRSVYERRNEDPKFIPGFANMFDGAIVGPQVLPEPKKPENGVQNG